MRGSSSSILVPLRAAISSVKTSTTRCATILIDAKGSANSLIVSVVDRGVYGCGMMVVHADRVDFSTCFTGFIFCRKREALPKRDHGERDVPTAVYRRRSNIGFGE